MKPSSSSGTSNSLQNPKRSVSSLSSYPSSGNRPGSSLNVASLARPLSRTSNRPLSRASTHRPKSRQRVTSARLLHLCDRLINAIAGPSAKTTAEEADDVETERDRGEVRRRELVDFAVTNLSMEGVTISKAAVTLDKERVGAMIRGHVEKARIRSNDTLAEALETCYNELTSQIEKDKDLDAEIKESRLPAHMQLLLALSQPPGPSTLTHASLYLDSLKNPPVPAISTRWTWAKILAEEPFEGDHWIGVPGGIPKRKCRGLEDGNGDNDEDGNSSGSTPSLSSLDTDDDLELAFEPISTPDHDESSISFRSQVPRTQELTENPIYATHAYRQEVENLKNKQYWREDWKMDEHFDGTINQRGTFKIGDASTLGPTLQRVLPPTGLSLTDHPSNFAVPPLEVILSIERYIYEQDAVREILIALQGRKNIIFEWKDGRFATTKTTPRLLHLSLASQQSIFSTISRTCTVLQHLRNFTSFTILHSSRSHVETTTLSAIERNRARKGKITRTLEAFADAVDAEIRSLESWCAKKEETIIKATGGVLSDPESSLVVSLLNIEKEFRDTFEESFDVLLDVVLKVVGKSAPHKWDLPNRSTSTTTTLLLDTLFSAMQSRLERGDKVTADSIMRVFVHSAEAVWSMIGKWLKDGFEPGLGSRNRNGSLVRRETELEEEFFIESTGIGVEMGIIGLLDPDFWADGYALRDDEVSTSVDGQVKGIPSFLYHVAPSVLETGKSIGLLKALDTDLSLSSSEGPEFQTIGNWKWWTFRELVTGDMCSQQSEAADDRRLFSVSVDRLSQLIYDSLTPYADAVRSVMARVVIEECDFWFHLRAIQAIYLMRRGDVISDFANLIFAKMDAKQHWNDFHFLNTAFSDVVELSNSPGSGHWLQTSLVRFLYRSNAGEEKTATRTVKAIEGLSLEYAVPFPLTYIFTPRNLQVYGDIFVFLLQIRRSKYLLERILVRGERGKSEASRGLKLFYAMRSRLSWFINTILKFMATNVIQTQVGTFREQLKQPRSLDHIIQLHDEHLKKVQERCLLQPKTLTLHQAIISVLDMVIIFSDAFASFSGNASTHDLSTHSVTLRHRSRRLKKRRKNVVGFTQFHTESSDSEPEYTEEGEKEYLMSLSVSVNTTFEDGDYLTRISKMSTELDGLVRFIRRGVEALAGGTSDAAATFGVLAFALEDWDL
ncbi:hypothetical protein L218DRAFT_956662 [Marasmius fiardii PR-910]|nr:hypothetical protein L218DRAFT_956662 [Marasmius fiardii PR-910]